MSSIARENSISPTWTTLNLHEIFIKLPLDRAKPQKKKKKKEERDKQAIKRHVEDRYCGDAISHSSSNKIVYTTLDINRRIYAWINHSIRNAANESGFANVAGFLY